MREKVCIVTAVHNDLENLKKLLKSIESQSYKHFSIVVVDDHSTDGVHKFIKTNYPKVIYLKGNGKLWWTGSINKAIKFILTKQNIYDYILTINNDCEFDANYLSNIIKMASKNKIVGSKIVDSKTLKTWDLGAILDWKNGNILPRKTNRDHLDALTTKGTLYPTELFQIIGPLSKHLPHYLSDYEIAVRAKNKGYKLILCEKCIVRNDTSNTGIGDKINNEKDLSNLLSLAFSRKSKVNIIDQFWFTTLACPKKYKLKNYLLLALKSLKVVGRTLTPK